ncbi:cytochrome-c peroxidase [Pseudoxanthomonas sp.]|uniref:cytochrome-c peroxidase n=1 Tax=Pseudoxanthomonas sp. TaxID=1871049 RepID=UPI003F7FF7A9
MDTILRKRSITLAAATALSLSLSSCFTGAIPSADRSLVELGREVFNDRRLSANNDVSCASCHLSEHSFADGHIVSIGTGKRSGTRNSPSLLDTGKAASFFWDGRETSLREVVLQPFTNPVEMGLTDMEQLAVLLASRPEYAAFLRHHNGATQLDQDRLASALSAYIGSLPAPDGPAFRHLAQETVLDEQALAGMALFNGKAECGTCHVFNRENTTLTDNKSHHTGIGFEQVAGNISSALDHLDEVLVSQPLGHAVLSDSRVSELGKFSFSRKVEDLGAFRTPSLRNVARTAPYMHDGSVPTLEEALEREIYYRNLSRSTPIHLTVEEKQALLAFLHALSDDAEPSPPSPS